MSVWIELSLAEARLMRKELDIARSSFESTARFFEGSLFNSDREMIAELESKAAMLRTVCHGLMMVINKHQESQL